MSTKKPLKPMRQRRRRRSSVSWNGFVQEHIQILGVGSNADAAQQALDQFALLTSPVMLEDVVFSNIESFFAALRRVGNSNATINKKLRYLKAALAKAVKRKYIEESPMDGWRFAPEEAKILRVLADWEQRKALDTLRVGDFADTFRAFVRCALGTGARRGELLNLQWSDIDIERSEVVFKMTKGHKDRAIPVSRELLTLLRSLRDSTSQKGPFCLYNPRTLSYHFDGFVRATGLKKFTIHDLRRTFCTDLAREGVNQIVIQRLAGHSDAATTAQYYQWVDDEMKKQAVEKRNEKHPY